MTEQRPDEIFDSACRQAEVEAQREADALGNPVGLPKQWVQLGIMTGAKAMWDEMARRDLIKPGVEWKAS